MKHLKRLSAAVVLTCVLGLSAFAGETPTGPCAPPVPGQTETMPCTGSQMAPDNPAAPGQTETPPAFAAADATTFAISLFESLLSIF